MRSWIRPIVGIVVSAAVIGLQLTGTSIAVQPADKAGRSGLAIAPAAPQNLTAVADQTARTVTLDWADVAGASYTVYESGSPEGRAGFGVGTTSRSVRGPLGEDRAYTYWVTATVAGQESVASNQVVATIGASTPPPSGDALWSSTFDDFDDFRDGDSGIRQIDPPRTTADIVTDPAGGSNKVGKFTINSGSRAEFMPRFRDLVEGDDLWFGVSTRLGTGYPLNSAWQVVLQWKNDGQGSPPLSLVAEGGQYKLHGGYGHPSGDRSFTQGLGASSVNTWDRWVLHVKFSSNPTVGYVEVWRNGTKVLNPYKPRGGTLYPGLNSYLKVGYYRNSSIGQAGSVYYDNYRVGSTQSAV